MANQTDLVEVVHTLKQVVCVKMSALPGRLRSIALSIPGRSVMKQDQVRRQMRQRHPITLYQGPPSGPSTGRKVVDGIANAAGQAKRFGREVFDRFKKR